MRNYALLLLVVLLAGSSCHLRRIKGNGRLQTEDRQITRAEKIKLAGSYDVAITQGSTTSVKVEADENLLKYIQTYNSEGYLVVKTRDGVSLNSDNPIKVLITTPRLSAVTLAGSGNVVGSGKFTGSDQLLLKIAGSGDITMEVNTPSVKGEIAGSGSIRLKGETMRQEISIAGAGDYYAEELKSEDTKVKIAGSGDVKVFADMNLDVNIAGVGSVYYKGAATVKQKVAGSGEVRKIEQ
jgi:hypothetical protein